MSDGMALDVNKKRVRSDSGSSSPRSLSAGAVQAAPDDTKRLKLSPPRTSVCDTPPSPPCAIPLRRRVNPESLAKKLGPELVHDLDALIKPGNFDMPSFAVRKELQERHNIDRRHIYDYFHSKGLRVIKEDKNGNPIRAREHDIHVLQMPSLRVLRQAPPQTRISPRIIEERPTRKPKNVVKTPHYRTKKFITERKKTSYSSHHDNEENESSCQPQFHYVNPLEEQRCFDSDTEDLYSDFIPAVNPLDEDFSVLRAIGDVSYSYRSKPVFDRISELRNLESTSRPQEVHITEPTNVYDYSYYGGWPLDRAILSRQERKVFYTFMSRSVGPAQGIQESVGTYKSQMDERSRVYFERLLSAPYTISECVRKPTHNDLQADRHTCVKSRETAPIDNVDFRKWLLPGTTLVAQNNGCANPTAPVTFRYGSSIRANPPFLSYSSSSKGNIDTPFHNSDDTLDDLFPDPFGKNDFENSHCLPLNLKETRKLSSTSSHASREATSHPAVDPMDTCLGSTHGRTRTSNRSCAYLLTSPILVTSTRSGPRLSNLNTVPGESLEASKLHDFSIANTGRDIYTYKACYPLPKAQEGMSDSWTGRSALERGARMRSSSAAGGI